MSAHAERRAESLFYEALELPPTERDRFLDAACGADVSLRAEVDELLRMHDGAASFLHVEAPTLAELEPGGARVKPEQVGDRIGHYKLLEQIGEGGFGTVWVAEQERPMRRRVALKIIKLGMDTKEVIARFEQERQALAMMDHPNIAKVLDAGATPTGRPYFVMELVRGIKITEYCDQTNLPTAERLRLFIAVCHAVQHAHQKGIIHRDLKPSNILVTLHDGVPVPKVIDFGVAKATQQQRLTDLTVYTQFEQMVGTPLYMSPEQAEMSGLDIDTRSDIYSLGVLLYELLVGRTPFDPEALMKRGLDEIRRAVREQEPQRPSTFVSTMALDLRTNLAQRRQTDSAKLIGQIRGDLDWIVMKALEKDRARRYETATSLAHDIQRHLASEPVQARPPTQLYRFRRFAKRNKVAFSAGAGIAAALLIGTAASAWQAFRAKAALSELRASAPAFAAMSRTLVTKEQFDEAIEKLDIAIKLRPDVAEYLLIKADLLESQLRFAEAAPVYRGALRLSPGLARAQANAELCEKLAAEAVVQPKLSRESLALLFAAMSKESRSNAEMMRVGRLLGEEKKLLLNYWLDRLKDLPTPPAHPLEKLLHASETGRLELDLGQTYIVDLSPLEGMPLEFLSLSGCPDITDLTPLRGMPLEVLHLGRKELPDGLVLPLSKIRDLSALRGLHLKKLNLEGMQVTDLAPLGGMPLEFLNLKDTAVRDLGPLRGMPLKELDAGGTLVTDLAPLRGMPLRELNCNSIPALDFSVLADAPLEALALPGTAVGDLSFLRRLPLKTLFLNSCEKARGFKVLSEIPTLETLTLPGSLVKNFPIEEMTAVEVLRSHPRLQQIQLGRGREGGKETVTPKEDFWKQFDEDLRTRRALARVAGGTPDLDKFPDGTWLVSFQVQPVSDMTPLEGLSISVLLLQDTQVTSVTALKGMPLKKLGLGGTKVADLEPLKGHSLTELYLPDCESGIDLSPLAGMTTLEKLLLPPNPQNLEEIRKLPHLEYLSFDGAYQGGWRIPQTAEQFWRDLPAEALARAGKFAEVESLLRKGVGSSDSTDWSGFGAVVLAQRDDTRFQAFCNQMLTRHENNNPGRAAMIVLSAPNPGIAATDIENLMQQVRLVERHPLALHFLLIEGLHEYRASRQAKAIEVLTTMDSALKSAEATATATINFPAWSAAATATLSMAYHREGNIEAAQTTRARARTAITANWPHRSGRGRWQDWLVAHLLLQEAEELIAQPAGPPAAK